MFNNKKGGFFNLQERWVEIISLFLLIIGFLLALISGSAVVSYILIIICGLISGANLHKRKFGYKLPFFIIIIVFLIGFVIGDFYGETRFIIVFFIIGNYAGYLIHRRTQSMFRNY